MKTCCALLAALLLTGCSAINHSYVVSGTGTILGLQIAENPATQLYEAKFGYARAEMALVPTNGPAVIMELRYSGIFSRSGGIYQRLAVGDAAVKQPGAAFMFAKDANGNLSSNVVEAITAKMQQIPELPK
jgi:hypothetical protein